MNSNIESKKNLWRIFLLIFKGIYHYIDLVTDILLLLLFLEKSNTSESPALKS